MGWSVCPLIEMGGVVSLSCDGDGWASAVCPLTEIGGAVNECFLNIHQSGILAVLFGCYVVGTM